ncbi:Thioesterase/thiol ester dehydrase-isomerase [Dichomitus squalens]|uniref:Thioesterase/thiol ester dehydrase-isomerase n=1 Tax=Dichomitus squalens TaxID=114155 RepID=A0A4Q9NIX7_9APHY|nr:Thioesterase/thiol ester dehydrase-isomerase [Dichomitus squalens]TBU51455.1 Thioesterase/thiol ester dehydrase-isomerase [Dichomitus squalens]
MYCSAINGLLRPGWRTGRDAALQIARSRIALPCARYSSFTIETLQKKFRDPSSPYHIAPGTQGPDSPDPPVEEPLSPEEEGRTKLAELGYDPESFWEQKVVWGDHDAFQHVNNVRYCVSLILKSISIDYKVPVTFPDTLLVAHKPHPGPAARNREPKTPARPAKTHFFMAGAIWSYAQRRIVTESDSVLVWYDYDRLTKCDPGEEVKAAIQRRMNLRSGEGTQ